MSLHKEPEAVWMDSKRDGKCSECRTEIYPGDRIVWEFKTYKAYCSDCGVEVLGDDPKK